MLIDKFTKNSKVTEVNLLRNRHHLHIEFDDGSKEILDCKDTIKYLKKNDEQVSMKSMANTYLDSCIDENETDLEFRTRMDALLGNSSEI